MNAINVYGTVPGQLATEEQIIFLEQVCHDTEEAIIATTNDMTTTTQAPAAGPTVSSSLTPGSNNGTDSIPTMSPTQDFSDCYQDMVKSDNSPRNNFLGTDEYTKYVSTCKRACVVG